MHCDFLFYSCTKGMKDFSVYILFTSNIFILNILFIVVTPSIRLFHLGISQNLSMGGRQFFSI